MRLAYVRLNWNIDLPDRKIEAKAMQRQEFQISIV